MTNRKRWTAALCLGVATLLGGSRLWAAEPERQQMDEVRTRMKAEGWTEISEGVFERHRGAAKVEHLGYGREGLTWHVADLTRQLETLMLEQESYPSEDLARIIDDLSIAIAKTKRAIKNMPEGLSSATAALSGGPSCSNVCYSATADAYPLTNVQGVGAVADAKFNSTCGYSGDTYAYAYARATKNGTTTTVEQEDPHTGTSITSHAAASVEGGSVTGVPCSSNANSYAQSYTLGIFYSTSDTNSLCPAVLTAAISSGPNAVLFTTATCATQTWGATASGGTPSYSFTWYVNNSAVGTGASYSRSVCYNDADFTLKVAATDSSSASAQDSRTIDVSYTPPATCSATISGTDYEYFTGTGCRSRTWTATPSNCSTPTTYQWYKNGVAVSGATASTYTQNVCANNASFNLKVLVNGATWSSIQYVTVEYDPYTDCNPTCK